ncbi:MAG TPA: Gfo/Idh/MocA family oxidoreductase [Candidatus Cryosericum sp.]|nr:Gfo/Idh/MocA family oxidoreductase [Candidatus Cryosericum sp.]HPS69173.1 Gfo/Idh/MocA family oxidoreductase [Candidatus Cryosericum sp.]
MSSTVRLALAGPGYIGRIHWLCYRALPAVYSVIPAQVMFHTVLTSRPDMAERLAFAGAAPYDQAAAALGSADLLDICTPNAAHRSLVMAALASSRPVYCEKPVDLSGDLALELAREAEAAGVFNQVALVYRFLPAMAAARAVVRAGIIGDVVTWRAVLLHASYLNPKREMSWRLSSSESGGGALMDLGVHMIDAVRMVIGEFAAVRCVTRTVVGKRPIAGSSGNTAAVDVDDWALVTGELTGGSTGTVEVSRVHAGREGTFALEVFGTQGSVSVDLLQSKAVVMDASSHDITRDVVIDDPWLSYLRTAFPSPKMSMGLMCDMHAASIYTLLDGVTGGQVTFAERPTLTEAAWTQRVVDACYASARSGERVPVDHPNAR